MSYLRTISLLPAHEKIIRELGIKNVSKFFQMKLLEAAKDQDFQKKLTEEAINEGIKDLENITNCKIEYTIVFKD